MGSDEYSVDYSLMVIHSIIQKNEIFFTFLSRKMKYSSLF
jgi:hypothetical protein